MQWTNYTNILYLGTEIVVAVTGEVSFDNQINTDLRHKNNYIGSRLYLIQCLYPDSDSQSKKLSLSTRN